MDIPIIVSAYDRPTVLARLLASLSKADYNCPVRLIISIDGDGPIEVVETAQSFTWPFGEKEIVHHKENLGLRNHILFCGSLAANYDGIILLEDDLYVSPAFYQYAQQAAEYYQNCDDIAGIALYAPSFNENAYLPFYPLHDGHDVYFMQLACSWGQLWLRRHWEDFVDWYGENKTIDFSGDFTVPYGVRLWPDSSWKKFYIKYMIERDKYFVYPRCSYTTNFGDKGRHHTGTSLFQVPLLHGQRKWISFIDFKQSYVKYDAYGEIMPDSLARLCPHLEDMDFVVDLYGIKEENSYTQKYVLTSKKCDQYIFSYCRCLLPIEYNIIDMLPGDDIFFAPADKVFKVDEENFCRYIFKKSANIEEQMYFYNISVNHYSSLHNKIIRYENEINANKKNIEGLQKKLVEMRGNLERKQDSLEQTQCSLEQTQGRLEQTQDSLEQTQDRLEDTQFKLELAKKNIELIRNSYSYRLGNKIIAPLSCMKKFRKQ